MNDEELLRYSRQVMLPEIEISGQEKLLASRVLIIGLGGLGSPIAMYLAAAGVGHLFLADDDKVELSNLQRQIIHGTNNIGEFKSKSAKKTISDLNPNTIVTTIETRFTPKSLEEYLNNIDLIIDATDNFQSRVIINQVSIKTKTPVIYGAAIRLEGQILVYDATEDSPCYECLYRDVDDQQLNCAENGVAAPIVGIIGTMQAMEAIRLLVGIGESAAGFLHVFDGKEMTWQKLKLPKSPNCPSCR